MATPSTPPRAVVAGRMRTDAGAGRASRGDRGKSGLRRFWCRSTRSPVPLFPHCDREPQAPAAGSPLTGG